MNTSAAIADPQLLRVKRRSSFVSRRSQALIFLLARYASRSTNDGLLEIRFTKNALWGGSREPSVESNMGANLEPLRWFRCTHRPPTTAVRSFPHPLIEPNVRFSRIRLSDERHTTACTGDPRCTRRNRRTPNSPKITSDEKRRVPRVGTLCRRRKKCRTRCATY